MEVKFVKLAPAPVFSGFGDGRPPLATIYMAHYHRMQAVIAAARSGNHRLIRLALAELDEYGSGHEDAPE